MKQYNLELKNINLQATDNVIVKNINLQAKSGEVTAILGPSGSGKTSLIKIIAGLIKPNSGQIYFNGRDITNTPAIERKIGYVSQNPSLLPYYNIWQNITIALTHYNIAQKKAAALEMLEMVDMSKYLNLFPDELSIGQQQKISILRALVTKPNILLFDEPYANLDVINKDILIRQTLDILTNSNAIKLLITHNPSEVMLSSDYVYVLNQGEIIQADHIKALHDNPNNEFVARLFGMTNIIAAQNTENNKIDTILGKYDLVETSNRQNYIINKLQNSQLKLLIRPHEFLISRDKITAAVKGKIIEKRFYYGQYLYQINLQNNQENKMISILSDTQYNLSDMVYIRAKNFYILQ